MLFRSRLHDESAEAVADFVGGEFREDLMRAVKHGCADNLALPGLAALRRNVESNLIRARRILVGADGRLRGSGNDSVLSAVPKRRAAVRCPDDSGWWRGIDGGGRHHVLQRTRERVTPTRNSIGARWLVPPSVACREVSSFPLCS